MSRRCEQGGEGPYDGACCRLGKEGRGQCLGANPRLCSSAAQLVLALGRAQGRYDLQQFLGGFMLCCVCGEAEEWCRASLVQSFLGRKAREPCRLFALSCCHVRTSHCPLDADKVSAFPGYWGVGHVSQSLSPDPTKAVVQHVGKDKIDMFLLRLLCAWRVKEGRGLSDSEPLGQTTFLFAAQMKGKLGRVGTHTTVLRCTWRHFCVSAAMSFRAVPHKAAASTTEWGVRRPAKQRLVCDHSAAGQNTF